ncbi:putative sporulation protein YtxC [Clostridium sp. DSM 8431]|uniref:putative sporulation protein YtxC n=1 Tax=Clostridium sp. DSM 8431 TaxID=1761781 RepID=UPI0008E33A70|nr:putative sporulation protein YtxC [Clostridium sp. DSM 8431]SFU28125.1 putative sporulation protein YtxC [Clostridium sp. DSM 8431]
MLVQELAYSGDLDFVGELQELKKVLEKKDIIVGIVESQEGITHVVKLICDDDTYDERITNRVNLYISNILYEIVISKYKEKEMFQFLTDTYFFLKHDEILEVEEDIMKVLLRKEQINNDLFVYCNNKINSILDKIQSCMEENKEININGFLTFRMRELREDIECIIEKVVEGYLVEKEYKEFVKLLKYFVDIQESKIEKVNIYVEGDSTYKVTDGYDEDIFTSFLKDLSDCKLGIDANVEDIIISGLISNAPKSINIYGKDNCKNKEFIDTIINVFGDRVRTCAKENTYKKSVDMQKS